MDWLIYLNAVLFIIAAKYIFDIYKYIKVLRKNETFRKRLKS